MIARVILDLPLPGHFDYLIPDEMLNIVSVGTRVRLSFSHRMQTGYVIDISPDSEFKNLKSIKKVLDQKPVFDQRDLQMADAFASYYGCSRGEALATMVRHRRSLESNNARLTGQGQIKLIHVCDGKYQSAIAQALEGQKEYFIVVPDSFYVDSLNLSEAHRAHCGLRSQMFEAFSRIRTLVVVDEDNELYKQEQAPRYHTRDVVLMASAIYGFDVIFVGTTPSPEIMHLIKTRHAVYQVHAPKEPNALQVIDEMQYKSMEKGIFTPAALSMLQQALSNKQKALIVVNRKGAFAISRCKQCGGVLTCERCDSPMNFSRTKKAYICPRCSSTKPADAACPVCHVQDWKAYGVGIEQVQKHVQALFPLAQVACLDQESRALPVACDVLIATRGVFRYRFLWQSQLALCLNIDDQLNRLDMRSSFHVWSLLYNLRFLSARVVVQTRNPGHFVFGALREDNHEAYFKEELALREELQFAPFFHWVSLGMRSVDMKSVQQYVNEVYNTLTKNAANDVRVLAPEADSPPKLRDQFRMRLLVGASEEGKPMQLLRMALDQVKRSSKVITTFNVDP